MTNILIIGPSGTGKSILGDMLSSSIFKGDPLSEIRRDDPSRESKVLGSGPNLYDIVVRQTATEGEVNSADILITMRNSSFASQIRNHIKK